MNSIKSISIVGTGNVAFHLGKALISSGYEIIDIFGRDQAKALELSIELNCLQTFDLSALKGDLVLLCVSDQSIQGLASKISSEKVIIHTSGGISIEALKGHSKYGVLYPLQTLSKGRKVDFSKVPLLIEANDKETLILLEDLSRNLSTTVVSVTSIERKRIHLAAVFVNNFVNHLVFHSKNIMDKENLDWNLLIPLLDETIDKLKDIGPFEAQTGPARRNDQRTIDEHLELLSGKEKDVYQLLTDSIKQTYKK